MNNPIRIEAIVEGPTEHRFIKDILAPYWAIREIYIEAPIVRTCENKRLGKIHLGGDIRFSRIEKQIGNFLKQRQDIIVASFVDFYGMQEWPSLETARTNHKPHIIAKILNDAALTCIREKYPETNPEKRYFPFTAIHEFESLLYSDSSILAKHLHIQQNTIDAILDACGGPENINNSPDTAPAKRLLKWTNGQYGKTTTGIAIAEEIGIPKMRKACPLFNEWLTAIEQLQ